MGWSSRGCRRPRATSTSTWRLAYGGAGAGADRDRSSRATPPIIQHNATASGTDALGYLTEGPGMSALALADGVVYHTYSTGARGLEFLMGYYPILDRAPKGATRRVPSIWPRVYDEYAGMDRRGRSSPGSGRRSRQTPQA